MKNTIYCCYLLLFFLTACRKSNIDPSIHLPFTQVYTDSVQAWLKKHISSYDYGQIDFKRTVCSPQGAHWFWKLPLKSKSPFTDFLLLQSDTIGHVDKGRWFHLSNLRQINGLVNGDIEMRSPDNKNRVQSKITNGYIDYLHPRFYCTMLKAESHPDPYDELQEVIVVAYRPGVNQVYSYSTFILFQNMLADIGAGGNGNSAVYSYGGAGAVSGTGSGSADAGYADPVTGTAIYPGTDITLAIEKSAYLPAIDVDAWLRCFNTIPDEGASFSVSICADLPVDDDPSVNVNLYTGATGHCFLQLQKSNGAQSITQVLGFTAQNALSALVQADAFVPSKIVDNGGHKYDASITMRLNASAFTTIMENIRQLSGTMPYSITRYDCLDFDLAVVNAVRGNAPLVLPTVTQQGNAFSYISTGERFYNYLYDMKMGGSPEAANIWLGGGAGVFAGNSHGPCN